MPAETDLIKTAIKRFELCKELEQENRDKCLDDLEFLMGNQWSQQSLKDRALQGRPALVVNRMDQFVQQITNAQRQNRVSARVFPVDDEGDIETAEVMQGLIRHIEYNSNADWAYDTAAFYSVAMGFAFWIIRKDYCYPDSFDQDLKVERVRNPFCVYLAPHDAPDGSDADYGFKWADLTKDEFEREFPNSKLSGVGDWMSTGDQPSGWLSKEGVRVVEYFYKEFKDDVLYMLADGAHLESEVGKLEDGQYRAKRQTRTVQVKWAKLTAYEVLEKTDWDDDTLPIVKVIGNELDVNGKLHLKGIVRNLKDAQMQYNYMLTAQTEAAMDRGQVVAAEGQLEGYQKEWDSRLVKNPGNLTYNPKVLNGVELGAPSRLPPDMSVPALTEARLMAADDLKALTGIYDAALGQKSNETSGRAITNRQTQSETANFHFQDNLTRSVACSTRKLVNLMPTTYDTARVVRVVGDDDSHKLAKINQLLFTDDGQPDIDPKTGKHKKHDFSVGKYDLICTAAPNFATKRREGAETLLGLAQAAPIIMNAAPDLIVKCLDIPYAQEIAERLKKTLPPQLQDQEDGQQPIPPEIQQQLQQSGQMIEQLTATVHKLQDEIDTKQLELRSAETINQQNNQTKEKIADLQAQTQLAIAGSGDTNSAAIATLTQEMAHVNKLMDAQQKASMQSQQLAHQADQAGLDREHQAEQASIAAEAQAAQADASTPDAT